MTDLIAPVVLKDNEKRIVYGPVLIPDEPDADGDIVKAERIEQVAHDFVAEYGNIDLEHSLNNVGRLVESYILPMDLPVDEGQIIPKGSWMMGVKVEDDQAWADVKSEKLKGFSIMAIRQKTAIKGAAQAAQKDRVTLEDLGDDWLVNAVSLVGEPAVPRAKFLAIKSAAPETKPLPLAQLENMLKVEKENPEMDPEQIKEIFNEVLAEQLAPVNDRLTELESKLASDDEKDGPEAAGKNQGEGEPAPGSDPKDQGDPKNPAQGSQGPGSQDAKDQGDQTPGDDSKAAQGDAQPSVEDKAAAYDLLVQQFGIDASTPEPAQKSAPFSNRIPGQDAPAEKSKAPNDPLIEDDRDEFGRKIRNR